MHKKTLAKNIYIFCKNSFTRKVKSSTNALKLFKNNATNPISFLTFEKLPEKGGIKINIKLPCPIEISFNDNICISTDKTLVLATDEYLHLNPSYDPNGNYPVPFNKIDDFNKKVVDIDRTVAISNNCNCPDCNGEV